MAYNWVYIFWWPVWHYVSFARDSLFCVIQSRYCRFVLGHLLSDLPTWCDTFASSHFPSLASLVTHSFSTLGGNPSSSGFPPWPLCTHLAWTALLDHWSIYPTYSAAFSFPVSLRLNLTCIFCARIRCCCCYTAHACWSLPKCLPSPPAALILSDVSTFLLGSFSSLLKNSFKFFFLAQALGWWILSVFPCLKCLHFWSVFLPSWNSRWEAF